MSFVVSPTSIDSLSSPPTSAKNGHVEKKPVAGLLIPTDRLKDDLEERWLPKLGRLRVEKEVILSGYSLYSLRTW